MKTTFAILTCSILQTTFYWKFVCKIKQKVVNTVNINVKIQIKMQILKSSFFRLKLDIYLAPKGECRNYLISSTVDRFVCFGFSVIYISGTICHFTTVIKVHLETDPKFRVSKHLKKKIIIIIIIITEIVYSRVFCDHSCTTRCRKYFNSYLTTYCFSCHSFYILTLLTWM